MVSKYPIYRLINDDDVIARTEVADGIVFLHNPMLIDIIADEGKIQVMLSPYTMYAKVIKAFQPQHVLVATEVPSEIIRIYENAIFSYGEIDASEDKAEQLNDNAKPDLDKRVLH